MWWGGLGMNRLTSYGWWAPCNKKKALVLIRAQLGVQAQAEPEKVTDSDEPEDDQFKDPELEERERS